LNVQNSFSNASLNVSNDLLASSEAIQTVQLICKDFISNICVPTKDDHEIILSQGIDLKNLISTIHHVVFYY
jgi:hypothetical protein